MNNELIELASLAIEEDLKSGIIINKNQYLEKFPALSEQKATFVTLNLDGKLRGCIGSLVARRPLIDDIISNAKFAAFQDSRFTPLTIEEFQNIEIEISILTTPQLLEYSSVEDLKSKIRPGIDGVILKHKGKQATFLPLVWEEIKSFDQFFHHLSLKAGLNIDCLKELPEIHIYQANKIEKESIFYKTTENNIECLLCENRCKLKANQIGICGVNQNIDNKIKNIVYGYPVSLNVDPTEKKPLYHFMPNSKTLSLGTIGCNFKCQFCQNCGISQSHEINTEQYFSPEKIVDLAIKNGCNSISYTYNEPTIFYPYARETAKLAKKKNIKNIFVSNGFQSLEVINDMKGLIDAVNIDLKSFNPEFYKELGGDIEIVKRNLKALIKNNLWVEITTLVIPDKNDSTEELEQIANFIATELCVNIPWHISAFHPAYKMTDKENTNLETLQKAYDIGIKAGLKYVYQGNINKENRTTCSNCGEVLINRNRFDVMENTLVNGKCPKCKKTLEGTFFMDTRETAVMGTFYPKDKEDIDKYFSNAQEKESNVRAIIAPHAGYIYSGKTADLAYSRIPQKYERIVVIGPSHKIAFEGASVGLYEKYQTPLGPLNFDCVYSHKLINQFNFLGFGQDIHKEHSTETQMPFIKNYFPNTQVVEIIYGKVDIAKLANVIEYILNDPKNLIIISTDLSHFHSLELANEIDNKSIKAIEEFDVTGEIEACGEIGVKALLIAAKTANLKPKMIDYRTSYKVGKDKTNVVGYTSFLMMENL